MTTMEKRAPHISGKGSTMAHGKSSLFDIPAKLDHVGSSLISLAVAPNLDMDYVTKPKAEYENTYRMDPLDRWAGVFCFFTKSVSSKSFGTSLIRHFSKMKIVLIVELTSAKF